MVIAYAHAHKTAIRWKRNAYGWTVPVTFDPVLLCARPYPTILAPLVPCHRPFPGPQIPHAAPFQTLCVFLVASVSRTIVGSLTFYYSLPQLQCVAQKCNTSEVVTFQGASLLFIDRCYFACSPLLGNSFSHCLIQHTCHPYRSFISKCLCYLDR